MSKRVFHAVTRTPELTQWTCGTLVNWLEKFVDITFPDHGIDRWSDNEYSQNGLKRTDLMPSVSCQDDSVDHIGCYAHQGRSEGRLIEVGLYLRNGSMKSLTYAKSFGSADECWEIARVIPSALEHIIFDQDLPEIVAMADKLPRPYHWEQETTLTETVTLAYTPEALSVTIPSGRVLDHRNWRDQGDNARFYVDACVLDRQAVLTNLKVPFTVTNENLIVDDLPGYLFVKRDQPHLNGYYVLPPGGNPGDDRAYLGYYEIEVLAIEAARSHRDAKQLQAA